MINKKIVIIIVVTIIIVTILAVFVNRKKSTEKIEENVSNSSVIVSDKDYDEETGLYYIKDEETGEILYASYDENNPDFEFYKEYPNYNPNPLKIKTKSLEDYLRTEEFTYDEE